MSIYNINQLILINFINAKKVLPLERGAPDGGMLQLRLDYLLLSFVPLASN